MRVDVWSDVVCPWCYIGKRNLEHALAGFEHRDAISVHWHAYELDPNAPRERSGVYAERLARKYGTTPERAEAMIDRMVHAGAEAGITMHFDRLRGGNTFDAHRVIHLAGEYGPALQGAVKERLLHATFTDGEPIGDRDTIVRLAAEAGLDATEARIVVESDRYGDEVRADERAALELDITGVPFFVFDRQYSLPGAQPPDVFARVLERAWSQRTSEPGEPAEPSESEEPAPTARASDGDVCDDGSCAV